ncbi:hypothetical protein MRB53_002155 [Persea americana]|uniref:Uncharacterized protein n=1 Tax=Persea americana TaxID=3435 RepID=A0ACC2MTQ2_PERAE|nr:hypothetical protein MRB53_002155 [Persea americana]
MGVSDCIDFLTKMGFFYYKLQQKQEGCCMLLAERRCYHAGLLGVGVIVREGCAGELRAEILAGPWAGARRVVRMGETAQLRVSGFWSYNRDERKKILSLSSVFYLFLCKITLKIVGNVMEITNLKMRGGQRISPLRES